MLNLTWCELKKMFFKKSTLFLLLFICSFGYLISSPHNQTSNEEAYSDTMELLDGKKLYDYEKSIRKEYAGDINSTWYHQIQEDYQKETIKTNLINVDESAMLDTYGTDWRIDYEKNAEAYETIAKTEEADIELPAGKKPFYVQDHSFIAARYQVLFEILQETKPIINKVWLQPQNDINIPSNIEESPEKLAIFQNKMNAVTSFYYDDASGWNNLLQDLAGSRFLLALFIIYLTSRSLNYDHGSHTVDIIKATKQGKYKVIFAKILAIFLSCCLSTIAYTLMFTLFHKLVFGLGNWNVFSNMNGVLTPYSFKDIYLGGFILLLCGSITIGFLSAITSAFFKKSFVTFALSLLICIIPITFPKGIVQLFPVNYMDFSGIYFYSEMMYVLNHYIFTPTIIYGITMMILLICCIVLAYRYRSYAFTKE